jgi:hypothetical protein
MTTIVLKRWHWVMFASFWFAEYFGWWLTLNRAPDETSVLRFLDSFGWMGVAFPVVLTAGSAFLTTVILAKLFEVFGR